MSRPITMLRMAPRPEPILMDGIAMPRNSTAGQDPIGSEPTKEFLGRYPLPWRARNSVKRQSLSVDKGSACLDAGSSSTGRLKRRRSQHGNPKQENQGQQL